MSGDQRRGAPRPAGVTLRPAGAGAAAAAHQTHLVQQVLQLLHLLLAQLVGRRQVLDFLVLRRKRLLDPGEHARKHSERPAERPSCESWGR